MGRGERQITLPPDSSAFLHIRHLNVQEGKAATILWWTAARCPTWAARVHARLTLHAQAD